MEYNDILHLIAQGHLHRLIIIGQVPSNNGLTTPNPSSVGPFKPTHRTLRKRMKRSVHSLKSISLVWKVSCVLLLPRTLKSWAYGRWFILKAVAPAKMRLFQILLISTHFLLGTQAWQVGLWAMLPEGSSSLDFTEEDAWAKDHLQH